MELQITSYETPYIDLTDRDVEENDWVLVIGLFSLACVTFYATICTLQGKNFNTSWNLFPPSLTMTCN